MIGSIRQYNFGPKTLQPAGEESHGRVARKKFGLLLSYSMQIRKKVHMLRTTHGEASFLKGNVVGQSMGVIYNCFKTHQYWL